MRRHGEQVVITHAGPGGPAEVARHLVTAPGSPRVDDAHYPPAPPGALNRTPKARTTAEARFLGIGDGAGLWLAEAAAAGTSRVRAKMATAVQLAALHGAAATDRALGQAAAAGRFADGDLAAILDPPGVGCRRRAVPGRRAVLAGPGHRGMGPARRDRRQPDDTAPRAPGRRAHSRGSRDDPAGALAACSDVLTWAGQHGEPAAGDDRGRSRPRPPAWDRSPGALACYVNLAIDYLDFAPAAGRRR